MVEEIRSAEGQISMGRSCKLKNSHQKIMPAMFYPKSTNTTLTMLYVTADD